LFYLSFVAVARTALGTVIRQ